MSVSARYKEMSVAVARELAKNDGSSYEEIAGKLGVSRGAVGRIARKNNINGRTRLSVRADGKTQDVASRVANNLRLGTAKIIGLIEGAQVLVERYGAMPEVRREATTLAYAAKKAARLLSDRLREERR